MRNFNATSIPSVFSNLNKHIRMAYYATEFNIPSPKLGVTYYGNLKDTSYHSFRVDAVAIVGGGADMTSIMYVHTPDGVSHTITNNSSGAEHHLDYFEDKEDYMNFVMNGKSENHMPHITLKEFLSEAKDTYTFDYRGYEGNIFDLVGYHWSDNAVKKVGTFFDIAWIDKNGLHIVFKDSNRLYTTKEECFKDNFRLNDEEFIEDRPKVQRFKVSVEVEIFAESETEAMEKAREIYL